MIVRWYRLTAPERIDERNLDTCTFAINPVLQSEYSKPWLEFALSPRKSVRHAEFSRGSTARHIEVSSKYCSGMRNSFYKMHAGVRATFFRAVFPSSPASRYEFSNCVLKSMNFLRAALTSFRSRARASSMRYVRRLLLLHNLMRRSAKLFSIQ